VARAAGFYVWGAAEAGHCCPVSMTYAIVPALRHAPGLAARFEPLLAAPEYDFGLRPPEAKRGVLAGMSMTEKQGGSDVRANTTRAVPAGPGEYLLTGHKWFTSAPMGDVFMVLAQAPGGLSCFLLPRVRPDGTRNGMHLQRLKDKLGNRSNASAEVEYDEALAWLVGEEGRGVRTIIEMVNVTRLDCVLGTATGMRTGLTMAAHHAAHRMAFGRNLAGQPLMAAVLADLAIESEAATLAAFRLAGATDRAVRGDAQEAAGEAAQQLDLRVGAILDRSRQVLAEGRDAEDRGGAAVATHLAQEIDGRALQERDQPHATGTRRRALLLLGLYRAKGPPPGRAIEATVVGWRLERY
jgi:putative acyl-CoA dehydrogenase